MSKQRSPLVFIFLTVFIDLLGVGIVLPLLPYYAKIVEGSSVPWLAENRAVVVGALGVLVLRKSDPDRPRPYKAPLVPVVPILGIITCLGMMAGLDGATWINFFVWLAIGLCIYFSYGKRHSVLHHSQP